MPTIHSVDVWRISLLVDDAPLREILGTEERDKASRFRFDGDRRRYTVAHAALRMILSDYTSTAAARLEFSTGPHGKPRLMGAEDVEFNLSHSGDLALLAVTRGALVGIDVEQYQRIERGLPAIERHLSLLERNELAAMPADQNQAALALLWVCKEAWIKATGEGLSRPLHSFDISIAGPEPRLLATRPLDEQANGWLLAQLSTPGPYMAAVAVKAPEIAIRMHDWSF